MSKVPARDEKNKTQNKQPIKITAVRVTEDTQERTDYRTSVVLKKLLVNGCFVSTKNQTGDSRILELLKDENMTVLLNSDKMVPKFGVYTAHLKR